MRAFFDIGYVNFSIRTDNKRDIAADSILEQLGIKNNKRNTTPHPPPRVSGGPPSAQGTP